MGVVNSPLYAPPLQKNVSKALNASTKALFTPFLKMAAPAPEILLMAALFACPEQLKIDAIPDKSSTNGAEGFLLSPRPCDVVLNADSHVLCRFMGPASGEGECALITSG